MKLTAENVHKIFMECLHVDGEDTIAYKHAEGVKGKVGFSRKRLFDHAANIASMLEDLPVEFYKDTGGGYTFLNLVLNKSGQQWTDMHQIADELLMLGLAINKIEYNMPRALWQAFPGGMPYLFIK